MRLFEISEAKITRVDCTCIYLPSIWTISAGSVTAAGGSKSGTGPIWAGGVILGLLGNEILGRRRCLRNARLESLSVLSNKSSSSVKTTQHISVISSNSVMRSLPNIFGIYQKLCHFFHTRCS